ncbi:uncharacterized [Tachysurus ichikawai]
MRQEQDEEDNMVILIIQYKQSIVNASGAYIRPVRSDLQPIIKVLSVSCNEISAYFSSLPAEVTVTRG